MRRPHFILAAVSLATLVSPARAQTVFSAAGPNAAAIQGSVDNFRTALGTLNANVAGSFGSGRREINWDGVPDPLAAPNLLPSNFFNVNSPRGVVFSTAGTGFQVSASAAAGAVEFGTINPTYSTQFATFSPQRLFTAVGSNVLDVRFFVPGSTTAALVNGFGSVFTDVDLANTTSIQFFDASNISLGTFFAPNLQGSETLSFLGVRFATPIVSRVRITSGNTALGPNDTGNVDVVAMDDFIYGEPVAATAAVPEPATWAMMIAGFGLVGGRLRWRGRARAAKRPAHVLPC